MNALLSVIRNIALLVLVSSFWELLAPRGSLRGPVRLVMGLLVVACVALPLTDALARDPTPWQLEDIKTDGAETSLAQGEEIAAQMLDTARQDYERQLARQVASLVMLGEGVAGAQAAVKAGADGALERVTLQVELTESADPTAVQSKLTELIGTFFAVDASRIEYRVQENPDKEAVGDGR